SALIGDGEPVDEALTAGFSLSFLTGAVLVAIAAVLTFVLLPGPKEAQRAFGRRVLTGAAVVIAAFVAIEIGVPRSQAAPPGEFTTNGAVSYVSEPGLHPPQLQVVKPFKGSDRSPGYFLTANFLDVTEPPIIGQSGPMILDDDMQPVWFKPVPTEVLAANLDVHTYEGKPVLAYWQGDVGATGEINTGEIVIVDSSYRTVAKLQGKDGWVITLHSLYIKDGLAWVTANRNVQEDLSDVGGVNHGVLMDSGLQAYDIKTGELRYTWSARDHIPLRDSETQPPPNGFPWDAYHINWLQLTDDGKALVSMRNLSAAYLIDLDSGKIEWQLGGKRSDFEFGPDAEFEWQHDVTLHDDSTVTLFDNHCCEITGAGEYIPSDRGSRALRLELDTENMTARVADQFSHGETFRSQYMGNMQTLENGNVLVGFGEVPYITEFSRDGEIIFDAALPGSNQTYRVHRRQWVGRPTEPPSVAARGGKVYASWNGATEVRRWRVVAEGSTTPVAEADKKGFETAIDVPDGQTRLKVQALDGDGQVIGTSKTITTRGTG
ncbi:MAG TPA: arylsulfotransferase family protein, partial [Solirubrobacter sp.]|nr:arylsulfotransferase family protein [Solirubrobacter sp.]